MSRSWIRHALAGYLACSLGACTSGCSSVAFDEGIATEEWWPEFDAGVEDAGDASDDDDDDMSACEGDEDDCGYADFVCIDGKELTLDLVCDGFADCVTGEDENRIECAPTYDDVFTCDDGEKIPLEWQCDGFSDCQPHGEDELDCPEPFQCFNGIEIHFSWVCDGENDCPEGEDELSCEEGDAGVDGGTSDGGVDGGLDGGVPEGDAIITIIDVP